MVICLRKCFVHFNFKHLLAKITLNLYILFKTFDSCLEHVELELIILDKLRIFAQ